MAVDTLAYRLAAVVTPANEQDRAQVSSLAKEVHLVASGQSVTLASADQGYAGEVLAQAAKQHGIDLPVINCCYAVGADGAGLRPVSIIRGPLPSGYEPVTGFSLQRGGKLR